MLVPKLRFREFKEEWNKYKLNNIVTRIIRKNKNNESNLPLTISAQYGLVDQITFFNKNVSSSDLSNYYLLYNGEFAYNKSYSNGYPWGTVKKLKLYDKGVLSSLYICFSINQNMNSDFLEHYFESTKWYYQISQIAVEGARNHGLLNIAVDDFFNTKHYFPNIKEQEKIANFLNLLDKKIELQQRKIEALKIYKKGLIQKMYQKNYNNKIKMEKILIQKSIRNTNDENYNVYSVSNKDGFILQTEQFKDRIVASEDTKNYKVVEKDDFAYNPARINVGSVARMKKDTKGIISPMYICFKCNEEILPEYLEYFFESSKFTYEMNKRLEGSVRMCLSYESMLNIPIELPNKNEQEEISKILNNLSDKIKLEEEKKIKLNKLKKGLLQKMFI